MKNIVILIFLFITPMLALAQPSNDNCGNAYSFGSLPTPTACSKGSGGDGATVSYNATNIDATAAVPYVSILDCGTGTADMTSPAQDVWFSFVATGNSVDVALTNLTGGLSPNIGFWTGNCTNLTALGCALGATATFEPLTPGQTYYIQVSGNTATNEGNFTITLDNNNDCNDCNTESILTISPLPVNGTYSVGQEVTFCYQILTYNEVSSNWLHGVQIDIGPGWDTGFGTNGLSNISITPTSCSGSGTWDFYPTGIGTVNGTNWGMGFYYDYNSGPSGPGNNYGDYRASNCDLEFCFTLRADDISLCNPLNPSSLNVTINTSADGESGSWTSLACQDDPATTFDAILACCTPPNVVSQQTSCFSVPDGQATATATNVISPWDYQWYDSDGNLVSETLNSGSNTNTATGLGVGFYTVVVTDNSGCVSANVVEVTSAPGSTVSVPTNQVVCVNDIVSEGVFTIDPLGGNISWTNSNPSIGLPVSGVGNAPSFTATNNTSAPITATITVTPTSAGGCAGPPSSYTIIVNPAPIINISSSQTICANETVNLSAAYSPIPSTTPITFESFSLCDIPNGCNGKGCVVSPGSCSVSSTNILPSTLSANQIVEVCFTIKHKAPSELIDLTFTLNGVTYTSANPAPGGQTYNPDLAAVLTTIQAAGANASVEYCLPDTFLRLLELTPGGASNTSWEVGITDPTSGGNQGDFLGVRVVINNTPIYSYSWSPTASLSNGSLSGNTDTSPLTIDASPASTTTYTLSINDPQSGCTGIGTVTLTVDVVDPLFTQLGPYCVNDTPGVLPTTSNNGVSGTWNASISTASAGTVQYTFTPDDLNCNNIATMDVVVNSPTLIPTFTQLGPYCLDATPGTLPTTSTNGINGTWNASVSTSAEGTIQYTFTPTAGQCATIATMDVEVTAPNILPTFTQLGPYCLDATPGTLPTTSTNGINGTWNASVSTSAEGTIQYTFTPTAGQCATTATMDVEVTAPNILPTFTQLGPYCLNASPGTLPTTSTNGINGTWNASVSTASAGSVQYTFTPTAGQCATTATMTVVVNNLDNAGFSYTTSTYCLTGSDPTPTITGLFGGTFTATGALGSNINGSTGQIDLDATGVGGPFTVTYTTNGTCPNTATFNITIVSSPSAVFSYGGPFCQNDVATTETPSFGVGASAGAFSASPAGLSINPTTGVVTFATSSPGLYDVTNFIAASGGCASAQDIQQIEIKLVPTVNDPTDQELCAGQSISAVTFSGNDAGTSYDWTNDTPSIGLGASSNGNITSFATTNSGTSNVVATIEVTPSLNGCTGTPQEFTITVKPVPTVNAISDQEICINASTTDVNFSGNMTGTTTFGWVATGDNIGLSSVSPNDILSFTPSAAGTTTITVTPVVNGCTGTPTDFDIIVNPLPVISGTLNLCLGAGTTQLAATGTPDGSTPWTSSNTTVASVSSTGLVTLNATGTSTITYLDDNGCSNTATLVVTDLDDPSFTISNYCEGSTSTPVVTGLSGGTFTFNPVPADGATINPSTGVISGGVGGTTYSVEYSTPVGPCQNSTIVDVTVLEVPTATITGGADICFGEVFPTLTVDFTGTGAWTFDLNGTSITTDQNPYTFVPSTSGVFTVSEVQNAECVNSTNSSSTEVVVYTVLADFIANPETGVIPLEVTFTNQSSVQPEGPTLVYEWNFGDGTTSTETNPIHTFGEVGTFEVQLIALYDLLGCVDTAYLDIITLGEVKVEIPNVFTPDGLAGNELFKAKSENVFDEKFQIFNRWGQLLYEGPTWDGKYNGKDVPEGTYYYIYSGKDAAGNELEVDRQTGSLTLVRSK